MVAADDTINNNAEGKDNAMEAPTPAPVVGALQDPPQQQQQQQQQRTSSPGGGSGSGRKDDDDDLYDSMIDALFTEEERGNSARKKKPNPQAVPKPDDMSFPDELRSQLSSQPGGGAPDDESDDDDDEDGDYDDLQQEEESMVDDVTLDDVLLGLSIAPKTVMKSSVERGGGGAGGRNSPGRNASGNKSKSQYGSPAAGAGAGRLGASPSNKNMKASPTSTAPDSPFFSDGSLTMDPELRSTGSLSAPVPLFARRCCRIPRKRRRCVYVLLGLIAFLGLAAVVLAIVFAADLGNLTGGSSATSSSSGAQDEVVVSSPSPTLRPTPTPAPTGSPRPTPTPSSGPSAEPTTLQPTSTPSAMPSLQPSLPPSLGPTGTPTTASPTGTPTTLAPTGAPTPVLDPLHLLALRVTDPSDFLDATSPQSRALDWMITNRANNQWYYTNNADRPNKIVQRYSLVSMVYGFHPSTGNASAVPWATMSQFVNGSSDECAWTGITCNNASKVESLVWAGTGLTGSIVDEVHAFRNLTYLDLAENAVGGSLPSGLFDLPNLKSLYLHSNQLTGTLSENFANLTQLENFYAGNNFLTGPIPQGLGSPKAGQANTRPLRYISLFRNQLTGQIPPNLNLQKLFYLDLSSNRLSGTFPEDWVEGSDTLSRIRHIYLDNNQMTGELPQDLQSVGNGRLESLLLSNNMFVGNMPGNYVITKMMQQMEIQNNYFSDMDSDICNLIVFSGGGEMVNFRADCEICSCRFFCGNNQCYRE